MIEYLYEAAQSLHPDTASRWEHYLRWASDCWQGRADQVIAALEKQRAEKIDGGAASSEVPQAVSRTITYLTNNRPRMDYPRYRREGLPVTSSLAESLVKQISQRVKGTEKFWLDGRRGEAILQIRAAVVSQDYRVLKFLKNRPISPYSPRCQKPNLMIAV